MSKLMKRLPEGPYGADDLPLGIAELTEKGILTLVGVKRTESEALFVTSESLGATTETVKLTIWDKDRYFLPSRKVNGIIRRAHHTAYKQLGFTGSIKKENKETPCTVPDPLCCSCSHCAEYGAFNPDENKSILARVRIQDLLTAREYEAADQIRIKLPDEGDPTPWFEVTVPPQTEFLFITRILMPTKYTLASFLYANEVADALGYGNYTKLRGQCTTRWLMIADGLPYISALDMIKEVDNGTSFAEQMEAYAEDPKGILDGIIGPDDCKQITQDLIDWLKNKLTAAEEVEADTSD